MFFGDLDGGFVKRASASRRVLRQVRVTSDCAHERYEPREIVLTCADGLARLKKLSWSSWTTTKARGKGLFEAPNCVSCAHRHFNSYPLTLTLSRPIRCHGQRHPVWSRAALKFGRSRPKDPDAKHLIGSGTVRLPCPG